MVAAFTAYSKKLMLQSATLQVGGELLLHVFRKESIFNGRLS